MGDSSSPAPAQSNTVTQVQQIPAFQQQAIQNNEATAASLAANPYPAYQAPIIAGLNAQENAGLATANQQAFTYVPSMIAAENQAYNAGQINPLATDPTQNASYGSNAVLSNNPMGVTSQGINRVAAQGQAANTSSTAEGIASGIVGNAANANPIPAVTGAVNQYQNATNQYMANNPSVIASYMNPYIQQSLNPQLMQAQLNLGQQQNQINSQATGANAFGDSRQATQNALQNYYGQQTMAGIESQGLNTGYNNAVAAAQAQQAMFQQQAATANNLGTLSLNEQNTQNALANTQLGVGALGVSQQNASNAQAQTLLGLGSMGLQEQGVLQNQQTLGMNEQGKQQTQQQIDDANAAQQLAISQQMQNQGLAGANAIYNAGNIQQTNDQAQLNAAYQQYENQVNWPYQQLSVLESAVNSSPYSIANATTLPSANTSQAGLNAFTSLAGTLGSLGTSSSGTGKS